MSIDFSGKFNTIANIPISDIVILRDASGAPLNQPSRTKDTTDLQATIKAAGQLQPIGVVRVGDDKFGIVFGGRRYTAIKALHKDADDRVKQLTQASVQDDRLAIAMAERETFSTVRAVLFNVDHEDIASIRVLMLAENSARRQLSLLEMADALKALSDSNIPMTKAAAVVGETADRARFILDLATAPDEVRQAIGSGKLDLEGYRAMRALPAGDQSDIARAANDLPDGKKMNRATVRGAVEEKRTAALRPQAERDDAGDMFDDEQVDDAYDNPEHNKPLYTRDNADQAPRTKKTAPALDSEVLINQAQAAVNAIYDLLAKKADWPHEARPALQFQLQRLRQRLGSAGYNVDDLAADTPDNRASIDAAIERLDRPKVEIIGGDVPEAGQDRESYGDDQDRESYAAGGDELAVWTDEELEAERQLEAHSRGEDDEDQEEEAELKTDDNNPVVKVEFNAAAPQMKFNIKVEGHKNLNARKRNAAGVIAYLMELAKQGRYTDSVTLEDLRNSAV